MSFLLSGVGVVLMISSFATTQQQGFMGGRAQKPTATPWKG